MTQQKASPVAIVLTVIITALLVSSGMYWWQESKTIPQSTLQKNLNIAPQINYEKVAKFNCEQSGGKLAQGKCECPQEPKVKGAPAFTYSEENGYCWDSFGIPGGAEGEVAKKLQELEMLKNK